MKPISETAFYCCGARMLDAASSSPVANDVLAHRFMTSEGQTVFKQFTNEKIANASCVMRHKIIDECVQKFLEKNPEGNIILLGSGFDTRSFRFAGGSWFELDEYQLIDFKNRQLPASECPNPLHRQGIDFSTDELDSCLGNIKNTGQTLFIIEGVFMYLNTTQISQLLLTLVKHFPQHEVVCDLMTQRFQKLFGQSIQRKIKAMGNRFATTTSPEHLFIEQKYQQVAYTSIVAKTLHAGLLPAPRFLANHLPILVQNGYGIYRFTYNAK